MTEQEKYMAQALALAREAAAAGARSSHGLSLGIIVHTLRKMVGGNRHTLRVGYKG